MTSSESSDTMRVLVISSDELFIKEVSTILESVKNYRILEADNLDNGIMEAVKIAQPEILIYDYRFSTLEETFDVIDDITILYPNTATVVIIPELDIENANKMILAGARSFLPYPFTRDNLLNTLNRVSELQN